MPDDLHSSPHHPTLTVAGSCFDRGDLEIFERGRRAVHFPTTQAPGSRRGGGVNRLPVSLIPVPCWLVHDRMGSDFLTVLTGVDGRGVGHYGPFFGGMVGGFWHCWDADGEERKGRDVGDVLKDCMGWGFGMTGMVSRRVGNIGGVKLQPWVICWHETSNAALEV